MKRVMTHEFGPATLRKLYPHPESKQVVWDVQADSGQILHLSQAYVKTLDVLSDEDPE